MNFKSKPQTRFIFFENFCIIPNCKNFKGLSKTIFQIANTKVFEDFDTISLYMCHLFAKVVFCE